MFLLYECQHIIAACANFLYTSLIGHASIVEILIKNGAEIDTKTAQESTSLMLACKRKHLNVAKILVASGAELYLKDSKNRTVLETAEGQFSCLVTHRLGSGEINARS